MECNDENKEVKDSRLGVFGIAAVAAGVAAGYFLYGKNGAKNRKKVKGWMLKAKGEVLEKLEKLKDVNEDDYNKVIDSVASKYAKMKSMDKEEVMALMDDLKAHWKNIEKKIEPEKQKAKAAVAKGVKKGKAALKKKIAAKRKPSVVHVPKRPVATPSKSKESIPKKTAGKTATKKRVVKKTTSASTKKKKAT